MSETNPTPKPFHEYAKRNELLKKMGFASYKEYLESPLWAEIRQAVMLAYRGRCVICHFKASVVHHKRYTKPTLQGRTLKHLVALCRKCHEGIEFDNGRKRELAEVHDIYTAKRQQVRIAKCNFNGTRGRKPHEWYG